MTEPIVRGIVLDSRGDPVSGAGIHIYYRGLNEDYAQATNVEIPFTLNEPTQVGFNLYKYATNEVLDEFNGRLAAAEHILELGIETLTNSIYGYQVVIGSDSLEGLFLLNRSNPEQLIGANGIIITDADGSFVIDNSYFSIGKEITNRDGQTFRIPPTIDVIAIKDSSIIGSLVMDIDPEGTNEVLIRENKARLN